MVFYLKAYCSFSLISNFKCKFYHFWHLNDFYQCLGDLTIRHDTVLGSFSIQFSPINFSFTIYQYLNHCSSCLLFLPFSPIAINVMICFCHSPCWFVVLNLYITLFCACPSSKNPQGASSNLMYFFLLQNWAHFLSQRSFWGTESWSACIKMIIDMDSVVRMSICQILSLQISSDQIITGYFKVNVVQYRCWDLFENF